MDGTTLLARIALRRTALRSSASLPALALTLAAAKHKNHTKKGKKLRKQCDRDCNELPDGQQSECQDDCRIAQHQYKKVC